LQCSVADLCAVVEASGAEKVHLFAASQASPVAIAFAAMLPEKVERLVIYGGYAVGRTLRPAEPDAMDEQTMLGILRAGWGKPDSPFIKAFETLYMPDGTLEQLDELIEMQVATIGAERVAELRKVIDRFDVSHLLADVQAETLVLHAASDAIQPFSQGQKIAAGIPGAKLHRLESRNHMPLPHEESWHEMMDQIDAFLAT
jgi:pimeloyl-ACP methyl ester carboxylesterase